MKLVPIAVVALVAAGLLGCGHRTRERAESGWHPPTTATLEFVNPWFQLPAGRTEMVGISVDGEGIGGCDRNERDKATLCAETLLEPGPHVISVHLEYRSDETLSLSADKFYTLVDRIVLAPGETASFDLAKAESDDQRQYVARKRGRKADSRCAQELHDVLAADPCTSVGLRAAAKALRDARSACASADDDPEASEALWQVAGNLFELPIERCMLPDELRKLPGRVRELDMEAAWPRGTVKTGSWWWARDTVPDRDDDAPPKFAEALRVFGHALDETIERQRMLEDLVSAWIADAPPTRAIEAAMRGKLVLDPRELAGHRIWLLLHDDDHRDREFADWLAAELAKSGSHCGLPDEAGPLLGYLLADDELSPADWRAVQAMVGRTPADEHIDRVCTDAARNDLKSRIAPLERLRWLATYDCSARRHPRLRADAVRPWLTGQLVHVEARDADRVREELVACVGVSR